MTMKSDWIDVVFFFEGMLYADPHRWGFTFQANAQMSIAKLHAQPAKAPIKVMERSIYSARYCFVENLYQKYHRSNLFSLTSSSLFLQSNSSKCRISNSQGLVRNVNNE